METNANESKTLLRKIKERRIHWSNKVKSMIEQNHKVVITKIIKYAKEKLNTRVVLFHQTIW